MVKSSSSIFASQHFDPLSLPANDSVHFDSLRLEILLGLLDLLLQLHGRVVAVVKGGHAVDERDQGVDAKQGHGEDGGEEDQSGVLEIKGEKMC